MPRIGRATLLLATLLAARSAAAQGDQGSRYPGLERAVEAFWNALTPRALSSAEQAIVGSGAEPDTVLRHLRSAPPFSPRVPKGRLTLEHLTPSGEKYHYVLVVPSTYDPVVPMPLRLYLHGGTQTEDKHQANRWDFSLFGPAGGLALYPSAWRGALWWSDNQVENLLGLIEELKRTYNIDENRISVVGVSDGGLGALYLGFRMPTGFASFLAFLAHGGALTNPRLGTGGPFFVPNLRNSPFYMVNGALDPLYPARDIASYVALYRQAGVDVTFRPQPESGHDLRWWPAESASVDSFIAQHPRNPYPDHLSWETFRTDRFNRAYWLIIDSLGSSPGESEFPSFDSVIPLPAEPNLGVRADPASEDGVRVMSVELGSLGGKAGLRAGDKILAVNGAITSSLAALVNATRGLTWGDTMSFLVERNGAAGLLGVILEPRPDAPPGPQLAFPRPVQSGRVELERRGNEVTVRTHGVRQYTLLLSPEQFDLDQPIRVVTNGVVSFEGRVEKQIGTLLKWAALDRDRTMMFLAELQIQLN
ncbi:MAG: PDZ domain-containing protein [Gemmatimonadota bacterium]